jgi:crotonobetainyl-CoA:carnitine CoA-transferase CaiB-like acyl-CoA transferase
VSAYEFDLHGQGPPKGPLQGIRIIDLSAVISGPFGTSILADQGADVIAVEPPDNPDIIRRSGPLADSAQGVSAMYAAMNRNKRSISLNLKSEEGRAILLDLIRQADVVVQNFRPGVLERMGLGWAVFSEINPNLIMCSVSGFGTDGPYSHRPAFDPIVQSVTGIPVVQAGDDGIPKLNNAIVCDKATSLNVAQSICAALVGRANGHGGQHIELAMVDVAVHYLWPATMWNYTYLDHETDMPDLSRIYKLFRSADGYVMVYPVATEAHWKGMCAVLGRADLADDPRFATLQGRVLHGADVNDELELETARYSTANLVSLMDAADVPVAPVNGYQAMIDDPHIRHRGIVVETQHPTAGRIRSAMPPARFSKTPSGITRHAPVHGQHTNEVLADLLAYDSAGLARLRADGIIS